MTSPSPHPDLTATLYPTVVDMLHAAADAAPERVALVHGAPGLGARRLTYRDYRNAVVGLAAFLDPATVGQGRVATVLPNSIAACVATFAVFAAGAQLVPLNPLYTARELSLVLEDADVSVLIADAATLAQLRDTRVLSRIPRVITLDEIEARLPGWMAGAPCELPRPTPDHLGLLQYTGGTTGRAKGVNLTHRAMATNVAQRETLLPSRIDEERLLCVMPIFHSYGMTMGLFLAAYARGTLVLMAKFQRDVVFDLIAAERITTFPASPTILTGLIAHERFATADLSSLSRCYSGSAPLAKATIDDWMARTGAPIFEGYGQTEAGPILTYNTIGRTRLGSVGVALPLTEIEIVDTQDGNKVLPVGARGEIRARGPQIMTGYRNLPEETRQTLRDGWLHTGDIGEFDADGFLFIRDRLKDLVLVGGYNVYPREIDDVLLAHPAVADAASVGVPDDFRGEVVRAFVVLRDNARVGEGEILAHCRANLAAYKVPVSVTFIAALPKTGVSKIDRKALREIARAGLSES